MDSERIVVIGSGLMGSGIALNCLMAGYSVTLLDLESEALEKAAHLIKQLLERKLSKQRITEEEYTHMLDRLECSVNYDAVRDATYVIEAVFEDFACKRSIFEKIDVLASQETILLSNTSGINIDRLSENLVHAPQMMGLHFFYPAPVMKLVELIPGKHTHAETLQRVELLAQKLEKTAVYAPNNPGFIVNRLIVPYQNEGAFLVWEGSNPQDVDTAMKLGCNHPMGPCELMDFTGIDVVYATMQGLYEQFDDEKYKPCPLLKEMIDKGHLGRKSGQGFYTYDIH